jgi:hypothetical protein
MTKVHGPLLEFRLVELEGVGSGDAGSEGRGIFLTNIYRSFQFGRYWVKGYLSWRGELSRWVTWSLSLR